jgi:hypothetical protein
MQWEKRAGVVLLALAACGCGSPSQSQPSPATTQPGVAADAARQPRPGTADAACGDLPSASDLKSWLQRAPAEGGEAGGLFSGKMEWAAVVDRKGEVCATAVATDDPAAAWPGSQAIAKAKAYTANAFSTDAMPLSTARLYTLTQPGHSLWASPRRTRSILTVSRHQTTPRRATGRCAAASSRSAVACPFIATTRASAVSA